MSTAGFHRSGVTHRDRFLELARNPPSTKEAKNLAARFVVKQFVAEGTNTKGHHDMSEDYFRLLFSQDLEPTNNHSEQQIRQCVIDGRITQGTRGDAGQCYHERMWRTIATCKKQKRNMFDFLQEAITDLLQKTSPPTLIAY